MRWKNVVVGLALTVAGATGCKQQCFLSECDYNHYRDLGLPQKVECDPQISLTPISPPVGAPTTVINPDRPPRFMTLAEAISISLEQGTVGSQLVTQLGTAVDTLSSFAQGQFGVQPDSIRVLALDP